MNMVANSSKVTRSAAGPRYRPSANCPKEKRCWSSTRRALRRQRTARQKEESCEHLRVGRWCVLCQEPLGWAGNPGLLLCERQLAVCTGNLLIMQVNLRMCRNKLATCQAQAECGDGIVEGGEDCNVGTLNGATCQSEGFAGGTLTCGTGCAFDTSKCFPTRFVDNGDGTITDHQTRLQWEKKDH